MFSGDEVKDGDILSLMEDLVRKEVAETQLYVFENILSNYSVASLADIKNTLPTCYSFISVINFLFYYGIYTFRSNRF